MSMEVEDSTTQTENFILGNMVDCDNVPSMRTANTELFNMLVFGVTFTLEPLFPLQLFSHAGITDGGFSSTMEVKTVKWEHS